MTIFSMNGVKTTHYVWAKSLQSCPPLCDPYGPQPARFLWSIGFSRQEYCYGLPFPPPGDLPIYNR